MSVWTSHALLWGLLAIGVPAGFGLCALIRAVGRLPLVRRINARINTDDWLAGTVTWTGPTNDETPAQVGARRGLSSHHSPERS